MIYNTCFIMFTALLKQYVHTQHCTSYRVCEYTSVHYIHILITISNPLFLSMSLICLFLQYKCVFLLNKYVCSIFCILHKKKLKTFKYYDENVLCMADPETIGRYALKLHFYYIFIPFCYFTF